MMYTNYPKGSEWRKWDLQVCTNKYTNYNGITIIGDELEKLKNLTGLESAKINSAHSSLTNEEYAKLFVEYLVNFTDISVVAITNHNTGEGIQEIINYLKNKQDFSDLNNPYNKCSILPGVEIGASDRCHILIIFNPETINKHKFKYDSSGAQIGEKTWGEYIEEFLSAINVPVTRFDHGKPQNSSSKNVLQILDMAEEWDFVPIFPHINNSDGWWRELQESNKKETYKHKNFAIVDSKSVGKSQTLQKILDGKHKEYGDKFIAQIHTSDAKSLTEIGKNFTWIKADPTFEGLKQIIYEPEERVKIQENNPEDDYPKHFFSKIKIKNTEIFHNSEVKFADLELPLNPNLVTIIGGRGTGKSLLLDAIAKTLKKDKNNDRANAITISKDNFSITFTKSDKTTNNFLIQEDNNIDYLHIYQGEVKKIVDPKGDVLDEEIKRILNLPKQPEISYEKSFINRLIDEIFEIRDYLNEIDEKGNKINTEEFINKQIKEKENLIKNITTKENQELIKKYTNNISEIKKINTDINVLENLEDELKRFQENKNAIISNINNKLLEQEKIPLISFESQFESIKKLKEKLNNDKENKNRENIGIIKEFRNKGIKGDITTLLEQTKQYQEQIENYKKLLKTIEKRKNELEQKFEKLSKIVDDISRKYKEFKITIEHAWQNLKEGKKDWSDEQKKLLNKLLKDIEIEVIEKFDANLFYEMIKDNLNLIKFKETSEETQMDRIKKFFEIQSVEDLVEFLKNNKAIGDNSEKLKDLLDSGIFVKEGEKVFFKNMFINYPKFWSVITIAKYKNKKLHKLSVGMKGTMYLCLKLATDPFMKPFVFDQPEDDLDNNFIVNELVPLFKKIKKYRQVIIVTHNANLVVNADAEQIVIAENNDEILSYKSGSIENPKIRDKICEILEGGKEAFEKRENKYGFNF